MTTPSERARSLIWAGGFLIELARDKSMPRAIRRQAVVIARHFPTSLDVAYAGSLPTPFGLELGLDSPDDIDKWSKDCALGPLRDSTRLTLPEED